MIKKLSEVSETLYVPLLGRIYATKYNEDILYDKSALSIEGKLPQQVKEMSGQTEYTFLASAARSKNMDYLIGEFLNEKPEGIIINVGCGLETTYYRNDNGSALWFELDLPEVIELRNKYFPQQERDIHLPYSMFDYTWMYIVKKVSGVTERPVLVVASGLFHYFKEVQIIGFIRKLGFFNNVRIIFDAVSSLGLKITKHYMKKMDKQDAEMFFWVDNAEILAGKISPDTTVIKVRKFYSLVRTAKGLKTHIRAKMYFSDTFNMVKTICLKV